LASLDDVRKTLQNFRHGRGPLSQQLERPGPVGIGGGDADLDAGYLGLHIKSSLAANSKHRNLLHGCLQWSFSDAIVRAAARLAQSRNPRATAQREPSRHRTAGTPGPADSVGPNSGTHDAATPAGEQPAWSLV